MGGCPAVEDGVFTELLDMELVLRRTGVFPSATVKPSKSLRASIPDSIPAGDVHGTRKKFLFDLDIFVF